MSGMNFARLVGLIPLLFGMVLGVARGAGVSERDEFNIELEANVEFVDFETSNVPPAGPPFTTDLSTLTIGAATARFFRGKVRVTDDPINETAFINRIMNFSLSLGWASLDQEFTPPGQNDSGDGPFFGGAIRYADPQNFITGSVEFTRAEADLNGNDITLKRAEYRLAYFWKSDWNTSSWELGIDATDRHLRDSQTGLKDDLARFGPYLRGVWQLGVGMSISTETKAQWTELSRLDSMSFSSSRDLRIFPPATTPIPDRKTGGWFFSQSLDVHITPLFSLGGSVGTQLDLFVDDPDLPTKMVEPLIYEGRVAWNFNSFWGVRASFAGNSESDDTTITIAFIGRQ